MTNKILSNVNIMSIKTLNKRISKLNKFMTTLEVHFPEQLKPYAKIELYKNGKNPINQGWQRPQQWKSNQELDFNKYNYGIICGEKNNLIVLDIDVKNDGLIYFMDNYIKQFGNINTLTIKTRSGGRHYYFNYNNKNKLINNFINKRCINKKLGFNISSDKTIGIDLLTNGCQCVLPESSVDGKYYKVINNTQINDIPLDLYEWLEHLYQTDEAIKMSKKIKKKIETIIDNQDYEINDEVNISDYEYDLTEEKMKVILNLLPSNYANNYHEWLILTTICKTHNMIKLWDEFSKTRNNYDYYRNNRYLRHININIDVNYLIYILKRNNIKTTEIKRIERYKRYIPLMKQDILNDKCKIKNVNHKYVYDKKEKKDNIWDYEDFLKYDTHIIQSCTGTGKTTAMATHIKQYMINNPDIKFISITDKITLSQQHVKSFENIKMNSYQKVKHYYCEKALTICINSLDKLYNIFDEIEEFEEYCQDYIVYIDEISSFIENLTHNDLLNKKIRYIYQVLCGLITNAKKVIVSDALINDNVINFLNNRLDNVLYYKNDFQKYKDIEALRIRDENKFLDKLEEFVKNDKYFLFASDSNTTATSFSEDLHRKLLSQYPEKKDKFILITSDTDFTIEDASEQFKNKFVFYSPKIIYSVDFNIIDKQDVFIHIKGHTITPYGMYQQITRTRNINQINIYCEVDYKEAQYKNIEVVETYYTDIIKKNKYISKSLLSNCIANDCETNNIVIQNKNFFKMYCYTEYIFDVFKTNKYKHLEHILKSNGIIIKEIYDKNILDKNVKNNMTSIVQELVNDSFEEFITSDNKENEKYERIMKILKILQINHNDIETLKKYQDIITNKYLLLDHWNYCRLTKDREELENILEINIDGCFDIKTVKSNLMKALLIKDYEDFFNIKSLDLDDINNIEYKAIDNELYKNIKLNFRSSKKIENKQDIIKLYVSMLKNYCGNDIIISKQITKNSTKQMTYKLNQHYIDYHNNLKLFRLKTNNKMTNNKSDNIGELLDRGIEV